MAACGGLEHIFEKPLPETPTLIESLSPWKQIKSMKTIDHTSFTELFGELHFKESHDLLLNRNHDPPPRSPPPSPPIEKNHEKNSESYSPYNHGQKKQYRHGHSESFSSMNSESLSLCTEGLGFESFDDADDLLLLKNNDNDDGDGDDAIINSGGGNNVDEETSFTRNIHHAENNDEHHDILRYRKSRSSSVGEIREFPPPISCVGRSGKPWMCFRSFREDGRFILKEVKIPTQEFLHACRENGRLKMQFVHSDDEFIDEDGDGKNGVIDNNNGGDK
ncbi:hypothetical protein ACP275_14G245200 [Erythranthe tilingii]